MSRLLGLVLPLALMASTAQAARVEHWSYSTRGDAADAYLWVGDDCTSTSASLYLYETIERQNSRRSTISGGWLYFGWYNWCEWSDAYGWVDLAGATFDGKGARGSTVSFSGTGYVERFLGCEQLACTCTPPPPVPPEECGERGCPPSDGCEECTEAEGCSWCWCGEQGCVRDVCRWEQTPVPVVIDLEWTPDGVTTQGLSNNISDGPWGHYMQRSVGTSAQCTVDGTLTIGDTDLTALGAAWGSSSTNSSGYISIQKVVR